MIDRRGTLRLVLSLVLLIACRGRTQEITLSPDEERVYKVIGETSLSLHVFYPDGHEADEQRPGIVFFHGGGWRGGQPEQFFPHCAYLAGRGMVAISVEYRLTGKHKVTPRECVEDARSAMRWVRGHARELGVDPNRLAAGGGSAGGHLAAATAIVPGLDDVADDPAVSCVSDALVLFNPVIDTGPEGHGYDRVKEYWREFSPMHNIKAGTPPTVIFLGTRDKHIPVSLAQEYKRRMEECSRRCDLHLYEGLEHGFFNYRNPEHYRQTLIEADRFLASLGYLQGEPMLEAPAAGDKNPQP